MLNDLKNLARDTRGELVEYLMLVGLIALACIGAFEAFGGKVADSIGAMADTVGGINTAPGSAPGGGPKGGK